MNSRSLEVLLIALLSATAWAADEGAAAEPVNLIKNGDAETGTLGNWAGFSRVTTEDAHTGKSCFLRKGHYIIRSQELIPVEPDKVYVLTGWFKSAGDEESLLYFGYVPFDEKKRPIAPQHVNIVPGTETKLAEACTKTDTVVKVEDASKWKAWPHGCVAFDVDVTGKYQDLPNVNVSLLGITKVEQQGEAWAITLRKACGRAYPAGTPVRAQLSGGTYIYNAAARSPVPKEWRVFTGRLNGTAKLGGPSTRLWPGTRHVQILILANYSQRKGADLLIDDMTMVCVDPKKPTAPKTR